MDRIRGRLVVLLCLHALAVPAAAGAGPVMLSSVTSPGPFYPWCGDQSDLQALGSALAPPQTPASCGAYAAPGSVGALTATFARGPAGPITASVYTSDGTRRIALRLLVDGGQVGSTMYAPENASSWTTFPGVTVRSADTVQVAIRADWYGSGYARVYAIHADLGSWMSPAWSSFGQPGNWATTPIPADVATEPASVVGPFGRALATEVPAEIAGQASAQSWPNFTAFSEHTYYVPVNTPLQPVRLCRESGDCLPNWGSEIDSLWRAAMGEGNGATFNSITGKPTVDDYAGGGIPINGSVQASPDTDQEAVICLGGGDSGQPPWVLRNTDGSTFARPDGQEIVGNCWEVWGLQPDPTYNASLPVSTTNTRWMIRYGARRTGFISNPLVATPVSTIYPLDSLSGTYWRQNNRQWYGPWVGAPGTPASTTYVQGWGVTAAGTPLMTDVVQQEDCKRVLEGEATDFGHAIGIQLQYTRYPAGYRWWPGYASDGNNANVAPAEGMRLFFPKSVSMPSDLNVAAQAVFRTIQRYGLVIDDQTGGGPNIQYNPDGSYARGGALNIRYELGSSSSPCEQLGWPSLANLPWGLLRLIEPGSDGNPNPTG